MNPSPAAVLLLAAACAGSPGPVWQHDLTAALAAARAQGRSLVVFFARPGADASDRMRASLDDPAVVAALARGGFAAVVADAAERARLYAEWVGYGEGFGIAVLDGEGRVLAARPGPQDPAELAALLRHGAAVRAQVDALRARVASAAVAPADQHALGGLLLDLGCRNQAEPLLVDAALAGIADARHRLARLHAMAGNVAAARRWLAGAPRTPAARATEGYVLFKERRHAEAVAVLDAVLAEGELGADRQRATLWLGKALHEQRDDGRAVAVLSALAAEGSGSTSEAAAEHALQHIRGEAGHPR
ncbi:MAG: hypothetical protein KF830_05105 [Planctomycetes bacterium]|nr:hypothetical protein [Planctomycetota bacterium]